MHCLHVCESVSTISFTWWPNVPSQTFTPQFPMWTFLCKHSLFCRIHSWKRSLFRHECFLFCHPLRSRQSTERECSPQVTEEKMFAMNDRGEKVGKGVFTTGNERENVHKRMFMSEDEGKKIHNGMFAWECSWQATFRATILHWWHYLFIVFSLNVIKGKLLIHTCVVIKFLQSKPVLDTN